MIRNRSTVKLVPGLFLQPFVVSQLVGTLIERVVEGSAVTASEFAVTSSIGVYGEVTPTELAQRLGLSPTTLSAMLKRLEEKGQVHRVRHPNDGRSALLALTAAGKATNARNGERFNKEIRRVTAGLEGGAGEVLEAMRRLEVALREVVAEVGR
jgi:DNA-binding MarR family transcriptional regulator